MAPEPKFKKGDYIINRRAKDMAVYDKVDKKGYMHFKYYYGGMLEKLKDVSTYTMLINYQDFYDFCTEEEKKKLDDIIEQDKKEKAET